MILFFASCLRRVQSRNFPVLIPKSSRGFVFVLNETIIKDLRVSFFHKWQDIAGQKYLITMPPSNLAESEREWFWIECQTEPVGLVLAESIYKNNRAASRPRPRVSKAQIWASVQLCNVTLSNSSKAPFPHRCAIFTRIKRNNIEKWLNTHWIAPWILAIVIIYLNGEREHLLTRRVCVCFPCVDNSKMQQAPQGGRNQKPNILK